MISIFDYLIKRKDIFFTLSIFIVALALRIIYFNEYKNSAVYPILQYSDSYNYYLWAKNISCRGLGGSQTYVSWPLYAYFLNFLFRIFGENISFVYFLQFIFGALNSVFLYLIAYLIFDNRKVALISVLLYLGYGLFIFYEGLLIYTSLSLFLNSLLFLFILKIKDSPNKKNLFGIGIFLGICTITQPNIVIFGILAVIWILKRNKLDWPRLLYNFLFFLFGLCIIVGSVAIRNYVAEKDFILISGNTGFQFYIGNNPQADGTFFYPGIVTLNQQEMLRDARIIARKETGRNLKTSEVSKFWFNKALDFIFRQPISYLKLLCRKISYVFSPREFVHELEYRFVAENPIFKMMFKDLKFILPFGLLGIFLGIKELKRTALLYLVLFTLALSIVVFFVTAKLRIIIVPFLLIFAAFGVFNICDAVINRNYLKSGALSFAAVVSFIFLNQTDTSAKGFNSRLKNDSEFEYHLFCAQYYEDRADYQAAIRELGLARAIKPDNHNVIFRMGIVCYYMKDFVCAEENFKRVIKIYPLYLNAYYNLGLLYNQQGRFVEAIDILKKALSLEPQCREAHFQLGKAYKAIKDFTKAREEFSLALEETSCWRVLERFMIENELNDLNR